MESYTSRLSGADGSKPRCLVLPEDWSGELWPVGMAATLDPELLIVVARFPTKIVSDQFKQIVDFMGSIVGDRVVEAFVFDPRRMAGAFNREFAMRPHKPQGLEFGATGLTLRGSSHAGLEVRGRYFSAAASTSFYLENVKSLPNGVRSWVECYRGTDIGELVSSVPKDLILVWYRDPSPQEPHANFTVARRSYGIDWLEVVNDLAKEVGRKWTTVGGVADSASLGQYVAVPVLNNLWNSLPQGKSYKRPSRLAQFAFFAALAKAANALAISWRSGSVEGCFLFTGIPTVVLDHSGESGFSRASQMCGGLPHATQIDVSSKSVLEDLRKQVRHLASGDSEPRGESRKSEMGSHARARNDDGKREDLPESSSKGLRYDPYRRPEPGCGHSGRRRCHHCDAMACDECYKRHHKDRRCLR